MHRRNFSTRDALKQPDTTFSNGFVDQLGTEPFVVVPIPTFAVPIYVPADPCDMKEPERNFIATTLPNVEPPFTAAAIATVSVVPTPN